MPMRHLIVTGRLAASRIATMQSETSCGSAIRQRAEIALLHAVAGTTDVEIDFRVTSLLAELRGAREQHRIGAADLQGHRRLRRIEAEQPVAIAVHQREEEDEAISV